jgi:Holliday junction DNA helicase RuvA
VIARLNGTLLEKHVQRLVVDVGGVGYEVLVPLSTFYAVGDPGGRVSLGVHTRVTDDAIQLFGFQTPLERMLFERLIGVNGVGPRVALAVLSGIELKDRLPAEADGEPKEVAAIDQVRDDVLSALVNLGYQRSAVEKAVESVTRRSDVRDFEALLREILKELSRP